MEWLFKLTAAMPIKVLYKGGEVVLSTFFKFVQIRQQEEKKEEAQKGQRKSEKRADRSTSVESRLALLNRSLNFVAIDD